MKLARRFLLPSSLARLVHKERPSASVIQGFFATREDRNSHLHIEGGEGQLILVTRSPQGPIEERTEVPRAHAEALVHVCVGHVMFERSRLAIGDKEVLVDRLIAPARMDAASIEFVSREEANAFAPPVWFGPEVTDDDAYDNRTIALEGAPNAPDIPLANAALDALLDMIEGRTSPALFASGSKRSEAETIAALRVLAASLQEGGGKGQGEREDDVGEGGASPALRTRSGQDVEVEESRARRAR